MEVVNSFMHQMKLKFDTLKFIEKVSNPFYAKLFLKLFIIPLSVGILFISGMLPFVNTFLSSLSIIESAASIPIVVGLSILVRYLFRRVFDVGSSLAVIFFYSVFLSFVSYFMGNHFGLLSQNIIVAASLAHVIEELLIFSKV